LAVDLVALVTMTALATLFIRSERTVSRAEGGIALALYATYIATTAMRG
jgi:Ca2+/Na+ antiporter